MVLRGDEIKGKCLSDSRRELQFLLLKYFMHQQWKCPFGII